MARPKTTAAPQTTAQRLDSIVKSTRKIMRKDKGLNGDLARFIHEPIRQGFADLV